MSEDLSRLLKESWSLVEAEQDQVAQYFYARLFTSFPQLRSMFPEHMQAQRARLMDALVHTLQTFDDVTEIDAYLRGLGRDHRKFNVEADHYRMVKSALVDALRHYAGEAWNLRYEQAWSDVYDLIADKMIAGAAENDDPPYWHAEVLTHERRGQDMAVFTCRPVRPLRFLAGSVRQHRNPLPAPALADVLRCQPAARRRDHGVSCASPGRGLGVGCPGAATATG